MRAETDIQKLKVHMARKEICQVLISDNGPSYSCQAFADFASGWGFVHRTSSPLHPISNGHSDVMVGVAKKILKKAKESKQDPYLLILEYRNSPLPDCSLSPVQPYSLKANPINSARYQQTPKTTSHRPKECSKEHISF